MGDERIKKKIGQLGEALVLLDSSDPKALADLQRRFEEVRSWASEASVREVQRAATTAAELVRETISGKGPGASAACETLGAIVSALQAVVVDGRSPQEVCFPGRVGEGPADETGAPGAPRCVRLPPNVDEEVFADFLARQTGVLDEMEASILVLEKRPDPARLAAIRRHFHTLKGEAAVLGLDDVKRLCHAAEGALQRESCKELWEVLLGVKDWLGGAFELYAGAGTSPAPVDALLGQLHEIGEQTAACAEEDGPGADGARPSPESPEPDSLEGDEAFLEMFVTEAREHLSAVESQLIELETNLDDGEILDSIFRSIHTIKGLAGCMALTDIQTVAHEGESLLDRCRKGDLQIGDRVIDVTLDLVDGLKRLVGNVAGVTTAGETAGQTPPSEDWVGDLVTRIRRVASERPDAGPPSPPPDAPAPRGIDPEERSLTSVRVRESVRVDADRLDRLVDTIGELVIAESMVSEFADSGGADPTTLGRQVRHLDKITRELQYMATSLRMVPIRPVFQKMARVVRDLGRNLGKRIQFEMSGEDTELDKAVVDRIGDPLVHLVRNAVDHGLEPTVDERRGAGKPDEGKITLRAFHRGARSTSRSRTTAGAWTGGRSSRRQENADC